MTTKPVIPAAFSSGYVTVDIEQSPNFDAGYEAAISGEKVPNVMVHFEPMPDFDDDPDCDPWDEPQPNVFGLDPEQAVVLAHRLLELAGPLLDD
jgi:hypothetical protein